MTETPFYLSARGLANIVVDPTHEDFAFHVGNLIYRCRSSIADFLSGQVASLHHTDPTIDSFQVKTADPHCFFELFVSLGRGREIGITAVNRPFLFQFARELVNKELFDALSKESEHQDWNTEFALLSLRSGCESWQTSNSALSYLSSHFHELPESVLESLEYEEAAAILSDASLILKSEDWLYDFISSHFEKDNCYFGLLEFLKFEFLSSESISKFVDRSVAFYNLLTLPVWESVCRRLLLSVSTESLDHCRRYGETLSPSLKRLSFKVNSTLDGILSYLRKQCGGNVHDLHAVDVTANHSGNSLAYAVNVELNYISQESPNPWVCIDFKERRIKLTHYSIRSSNCEGINGRHPREWVIEGSTSSDWREIDRRDRNNELNGQNLITTHAVSEPMICRFVRLRQTGKNHSEGLSLLFNAFEVFGELYE